MKHAALSTLLMGAIPFAAADPGAWRDLNLQVESLAESLVNAVPMNIVRFTGRDVDVLAKRMGDKWIAEGGIQAVRSGKHGAWTIISRIHGAELEVVQWSGKGEAGQLLWSRSGLLDEIRAPARAQLRFPPGCVPGRTVSGRIDSRTYWQQSARCKGTAQNALSAMRASAGSQGFAVLSSDGRLVARNGETEITVLAWSSNDGSAPAKTSLVYLQLGPPGRTP